VTRHGIRAAYRRPRVIPKTTHLLRIVACIRTRTIAITTLGSRTAALLPAAAMRGCATAAEAVPLAVSMTVGGV